MNQIHKQHLYFSKEPYRPLRRPYGGPNGSLLWPTVFESLICFNLLVFNLLHRILKVPRSQNGLIPLDFLMLLVSIGPVLAFLPPPLTVTQTMPKVLIWTSTPKLFSLLQILATFWQFSGDQREKMLFCNHCSILGLLCLK